MFKSIKNYFEGVVQEAKRVTWPTKKEVKDHTISVVVIMILIMVIFGTLDFGLSQLLQYFVNRG